MNWGIQLSIEWIFPTQFRFVKFSLFQLQIFLWVHRLRLSISLGQQKHVDTLNVITLLIPSVISYRDMYVLAAYTHLWPVGPKIWKIRKRFFFFSEKSERCCASTRVTHGKTLREGLRISTSGPSLKMASESCCLLIFFVWLSKSEWENNELT